MSTPPSQSLSNGSLRRRSPGSPPDGDLPTAPPEVFEMDEGAENADQTTGQRRRRRRFDKWGKKVTAIVVIFTIGLAVELSYAFYSGWLMSNVPDVNSTVNSHPFAHLSHYYSQLLNTSVNPCSDMYGFACGKKIQRYQANNRSSFDTASEMKAVTRENLERMLSKPFDIGDTQGVSSAKLVFQACIKQQSGTDMTAVKDWIYAAGGWPAIGFESESKESWLSIVMKLNELGVRTFFPFEFSVRQHPQSYKKMALVLKSQQPHKSNLIPSNVAKVENYLADIATMLNGSKTSFDSSWLDCLKFESKLLKFSSSLVPELHAYSVNDLVSQQPDFPWLQFFRSAFIDTEIKMQKDDIVWVENINSTYRIAQLLRETSSTTLRNYLMYKAFQRTIIFTPAIIHRANERLRQEVRDVSRSRECVEWLLENASALMGDVYEESFSDSEAKVHADGIVNNVKATAFSNLKEVQWLDRDTKREILLHLVSLKITTVGTTKEGRNVLLKKLFNSISSEPDKQQSFQIYRRIAKSMRKFECSKIGITRENYQTILLTELATKSKAFFDEHSNILYLPAALLNSLLYNTESPNYLNYGAFGFSISRAIIKSLRIMTICEKANFCPNSEFQKVGTCLTSMFNEYKFKNTKDHVNGKQTLAANLENSLAMKISYLTYRNWSLSYAFRETPLPEFSYSVTNWLWISLASSICVYEEKSVLERNLVKNLFSPTEAIVNVGLITLPEFSNDFNCRVLSKTRLLEKCNV